MKESRRSHKRIRRRPVVSCVVDAICYNDESRLLDIEYSGGEAYRYSAVPPEELQALLSADSIGRYVNYRIKPRYRFVRLGRGRS